MYLFSPEYVKVLEGNIVKIVWVPPEHGDAVACISADGIVSLFEEVAEGIIDCFFFVAKIEKWASYNKLSFA